MITTLGKQHVKRYMAQQVGAIAESVAYGIGASAEALGSTSLQFEVGREPVTTVSYDFANDRIIYKAVLPTDFAGKIYEVALFSLVDNTAAGDFSSKLITTFDSATETWTNAVYNGTNTRVGIDSLRHTPAASGTTTSSLSDIIFDLSGNSGADKFVMAYNVGTANTSIIRFRFKTDASNYYEFSVATPTTGYKFSEFLKSAATVTGSPSWANINSVEVVTTSTAGGASQVDFDAIRIEDTDTVNPDYVMVARKVLGAPIIKEEGRIQEIEYSLSFSA